MSDLAPFTFDGTTVRVITEQGEPWFVLADLIRVLGMTSKPSQVAARLADDEKGVRQTDTLGGRQQVGVVNEAGMWSVIVRSDSPTAEPVRRWVTHEVLPAIRRTGGYQVAAPTGAELIARAVIEAQAMLAAKDERIAEQARQIETMAPAAEAWDNLASTQGDYSMRDAAQILDRDPAISTGQNRLGAYLREIGWTDKRGIPYQRHVDAGRIRSRIRYYDNPRTGERTLADPQIRLTPKGVEALRALMTAGVTR